VRCRPVNGVICRLMSRFDRTPPLPHALSAAA
jgi:hypothetical protein